MQREQESTTLVTEFQMRLQSVTITRDDLTRQLDSQRQTVNQLQLNLDAALQKEIQQNQVIHDLSARFSFANVVIHPHAMLS